MLPARLGLANPSHRVWVGSGKRRFSLCSSVSSVAGSQTVEVRHSSKILGKVPVINLLRLRRNDRVRFAGRFWRIRKISQEYIMLDPVQTRTNAVDFIYPSGSIGFDAFLANRMWQLIHSRNFPFNTFL